jgi:hypothetical protein
MPKLSAAQIAGVIKYTSDNGAGTSFTNAMPDVDKNGPIAIAIALAESGGNTDAVGGPNSNGTYDYGLFQINQRAHSDKLGELGPVGASGKPEPTDPKWKNPNTNWEIALDLFLSRGSWADWSTYNNQSYRAHLLAATSAWANPDGSMVDHSAVVDTIGGGIDTAVDAANGFGALISGLQNPDTWMRVILILGGGIMLMVGAWTVATQ